MGYNVFEFSGLKVHVGQVSPASPLGGSVCWQAEWVINAPESPKSMRWYVRRLDSMSAKEFVSEAVRLYIEDLKEAVDNVLDG